MTKYDLRLIKPELHPGLLTIRQCRAPIIFEARMCKADLDVSLPSTLMIFIVGNIKSD